MDKGVKREYNGKVLVITDRKLDTDPSPYSPTPLRVGAYTGVGSKLKFVERDPRIFQVSFVRHCEANYAGCNGFVIDGTSLIGEKEAPTQKIGIFKYSVRESYTRGIPTYIVASSAKEKDIIEKKLEDAGLDTGKVQFVTSRESAFQQIAQNIKTGLKKASKDPEK